MHFKKLYLLYFRYPYEASLVNSTTPFPSPGHFPLGYNNMAARLFQSIETPALLDSDQSMSRKRIHDTTCQPNLNGKETIT